MNLKRFKPFLIGLVGVETVGLAASLLTRENARYFSEYAQQPPLSPPQWIFPVVWGILYALMGISAALVWREPESKARSRGLNLFIVQLAMNFFWTLIFFNAQAYGLASVWIVVLWVVVLTMILQFWRVNNVAAWLQVPYLLWLTFATYLTFGVWLLN
jgi:tryptophan-rich sensory protein